jgi:competence protein ComEC
MMLRRVLACIFASAVWAGAVSVGVAQPQGGAGKLRVYFVDVEGGQATLFVTPDGHSLLIDTGWPGNNGRDADRIVAAAKSAGLSRIDDVLITHYHDDHVGGVPQLADRMPIGTFIVHGPNRELDKGVTEHGYAEYQRVLAKTKAKQVVAKPGERLPVEGLDVTVISADGDVIQKPLSGAGKPNQFCEQGKVPAADQTENARSVGVLIRYGSLRILDLGDLTADKERVLMCPNNRLGQVDVLVVSHHGWYQSSSMALVDAVHPKVAIMDNGAKKGGSIAVLDTVRKSPGIEALWQLHFSDEGGTEHNTPKEYIANLDGPDAGHDLELTGGRDGSFTVRNGRTGAEKHYAAGELAMSMGSMRPRSSR